MMRKLAASVSYGIGKHTQTIVQNADELEVVNLVVSTGPPQEERCVIKVDGEEQDTLCIHMVFLAHRSLFCRA